MTEIVAHHGLFKDTKLHVDDTGGSGRAVILIHGWPLSGASFNLQVSELSTAGYRVVTYDRRGFGRSDKPMSGYTYDTLADDLHNLIEQLDLVDVTLVGYSMGGGEVARYFSAFNGERVQSVVFASSVTPYLMQTSDNPEGPLTTQKATEMTAALTADQHKFNEQFATDFYSVNGQVVVTDEQRNDLVFLADQADKKAALACMSAFANTDFREDLKRVEVPTLVIHGDSDIVVPFEGSGKRTHQAIAGSQLYVIAGAPHGCNVSHPEEWNSSVIDFLGK